MKLNANFIRKILSSSKKKKIRKILNFYLHLQKRERERERPTDTHKYTQMKVNEVLKFSSHFTLSIIIILTKKYIHINKRVKKMANFNLKPNLFFFFYSLSLLTLKHFRKCSI